MHGQATPMGSSPPPTVDELRTAFQRILNEEGDPDLTCLEARHLLERRMGLPHDGLLPEDGSRHRISVAYTSHDIAVAR